MFRIDGRRVDLSARRPKLSSSTGNGHGIAGLGSWALTLQQNAIQKSSCRSPLSGYRVESPGVSKSSTMFSFAASGVCRRGEGCESWSGVRSSFGVNGRYFYQQRARSESNEGKLTQSPRLLWTVPGPSMAQKEGSLDIYLHLRWRCYRSDFSGCHRPFSCVVVTENLMRTFLLRQENCVNFN